MRGRWAIAVLTALLAVGPAPAAVAADDPPSELWREFPLDPTTAQTPPTVPPAAGENEAVPYTGAGSQGRGVPPSAADDGGVVSPLLIAGVAAALLAGAGVVVARRAGGREDGAVAGAPRATVVSTPPAPRLVPAPVPFDTERFTRDVGARRAPPVAPSRSVIALDPARVARRGVPVRREEDVVARIAPSAPADPPPMADPPVLHEVTWCHRDGQAAFELVPIEGGAAAPGEPLRSAPSSWRVPGPPPRVPSLRAAHDELCARALAGGWEQAGRGRAWYAHRFRAPVGARGSRV